MKKITLYILFFIILLSLIYFLYLYFESEKSPSKVDISNLNYGGGVDIP